MIRHYQLKNCIIDLREMGVYAPGVADFINLKWFEQMEKLGVNYLAFVVPENVFGKASMNKAHEVSSKPGQMTTKHFKDQPSAKQWLEAVSQLELK